MSGTGGGASGLPSSSATENISLSVNDFADMSVGRLSAGTNVLSAPFTALPPSPLLRLTQTHTITRMININNTAPPAAMPAMTGTVKNCFDEFKASAAADVDTGCDRDVDDDCVVNDDVITVLNTVVVVARGGIDVVVAVVSVDAVDANFPGTGGVDVGTGVGTGVRREENVGLPVVNLVVSVG